MFWNNKEKQKTNKYSFVVECYAEKIKTQRSNIIFGYPSLITFFGYITKTLIDIDFYKKPPELIVTIEEFDYANFYQRSEKNREDGLGYIKFRILVDFETDKEIDNYEEMEEKMEKAFFFNRFSGGIVRYVNVVLFREGVKKENKLKFLLPGYLIQENKTPITDLDDLLAETLDTKKIGNFVNISGYNFVSNISKNITESNFKEVYVEPIYKLYTLKVLKNDIISEVRGFKYKEDLNSLKIIQKEKEYINE